MPEQEMHTTAFWLHFPAEFLARLSDLSRRKAKRPVRPGPRAAHVAALLLMCDPRDLGVAFSHPRLLRQTAELLAACECEAGCPSCVGPPGETGERGKEAPMRILRELVRDER
jgi:DEAD/DEAH box helicase domain-containing protein